MSEDISNNPNILHSTEFERVCALIWDKIKNDLEVEQNLYSSDQVLYHYTDAKGLRGIIENESFWFTDYRHLNDPTELHHGVNIAVEMIKNLPQPRNAPTGEFLELLADLLRKENFNSDYLDVLTCSFSSTRDDLGQWRAYGDDGRGFAIGLSPKLFAVEEAENQAANEIVFVGEVRYQNQVVEERYRRSLQHALSAIETAAEEVWFRRSSQPARFLFFREIANVLIASSWIWNSLTSKHDAYEAEREVRLIMFGSQGSLSQYIKTRIRGNEIIPYVPHRMPLKQQGAITEIVIGPAAHKDSERTVKQMLSEIGVQHEVAVNRSPIPYRVNR